MASGCEGLDCASGRYSFRNCVCGIGFGVKPLPLEVAEFHIIAIDEGNVSHTRPCEHARMKAAQCTASYNGGSGAKQSLLACFPDWGEPDLP
jgi:hypothetical protein